jgi:hypothetical protein
MPDRVLVKVEETRPAELFVAISVLYRAQLHGNWMHRSKYIGPTFPFILRRIKNERRLLEFAGVVSVCMTPAKCSVHSYIHGARKLGCSITRTKSVSHVAKKIQYPFLH